MNIFKIKMTDLNRRKMYPIFEKNISIQEITVLLNEFEDAKEWDPKFIYLSTYIASGGLDNLELFRKYCQICEEKDANSLR